ncbi:MAG: bifunctional diaminohydroxyphosphoribosylaminopyrimidine deaminase/5-amino-6-(5-phosphoribosylamino)uracil reductase RibD [Mariprofundaceae bacterium]|nr:bifunctional diaminohydroxyphosphoribosylaminopyrimidine deaminase/5-amino-6-(5-phosphoribosylamino)uracil reductase RibD [Mariprofundaceae bacterium]
MICHDKLAMLKHMGEAMADEKQQKEDERWMKKAIRLAKKGIGTTHPNPRVGAVVVKNGVVAGEGWHQRAGEPHAEIHAIQEAGSNARGGTLYVTLEPCSATGRTPPCTEAIQRAGIWRVVFASSDPNSKMAGGGKILEAHNVDVTGGVLRDEADRLNEPFFHYIKTGRPYVTAKAAISLDGKLATHLHDSQWISGEQSRRHAHGLRAESDAIIIGSKTLLHDNPSLTVRDASLKGDVPMRVVIGMKTPPFFPECKLLDDAAPTRFYVRTINEDTARWRDAGVQIGRAPNLVMILKHLAQDGCLQLLLEGGGKLHASFFEAQLTNELVLYQAPILIGGHDAVDLWHGSGVERVERALRLENIQRRKMGEDQMIRGRIIYPD